MRLRTRILAGLALVAAALALASATSTSSATAGQANAVPAKGPDAVGALFSLTSDGRLDTHFCTASVVDSPNGDVVLTAAHCLAGQTVGSLAFVPGYHDGKAPLGVWVVEKAFVDEAWTSSADPDHDFAFLVVARQGATSSLESLTGAERVGAGGAIGRLATVVGYPAAGDAAIACTNLLLDYSATQLEFDCGGYTNGTSGSALVVGADPATGLGTAVGVIGGFEQGGDTPAVSYAAAFGASTQALYRLAVAAG